MSCQCDTFAQEPCWDFRVPRYYQGIPSILLGSDFYLVCICTWQVFSYIQEGHQMKHCHQGDVDLDFLYRLLCVVGERAYGCRLIKCASSSGRTSEGIWSGVPFRYWVMGVLGWLTKVFGGGRASLSLIGSFGWLVWSVYSVPGWCESSIGSVACGGLGVCDEQD